jgi:hypothetical protein
LQRDLSAAGSGGAEAHRGVLRLKSELQDCDKSIMPLQARTIKAALVRSWSVRMPKTALGIPSCYTRLNLFERLGGEYGQYTQ